MRHDNGARRNQRMPDRAESGADHESGYTCVTHRPPGARHWFDNAI